MNTSILYHGFGLRDYTYLRTIYHVSLRQLDAYFGGVSYGTIDLINRRCKADLETGRNSEVSQIIRRIEKHLS